MADYIRLAIGLVVGFLIVRYSWRLTRYFGESGMDPDNAFGSMIGISVGACGVVIGLAIIVFSVYFLFVGLPQYPVSSG